MINDFLVSYQVNSLLFFVRRTPVLLRREPPPPLPHTRTHIFTFSEVHLAAVHTGFKSSSDLRPSVIFSFLHSDKRIAAQSW